MHQSSYDIVHDFVDDYVKCGDVVLEIGSCDVNGSHRGLFNHCKYIGLDIEDGPNVDVVVNNPHHWIEIDKSSIDVVICASVIEHTEYPWKVFQEIQRVLKPNGCFCIIAPAIWEEHRFPIDCYRFYPDGMKVLCEYACLNPEHVGMVEAYNTKEEPVDGWYDCYCIGKNLYNS